jgi:ABC-type sugar transport system permease subunit
MGQLLRVLLTVSVTIAAVIAVFVAVNAALDQAPKRWRVFAAFAGAFFGFLVGAVLVSGGWFYGIEYPVGAAAIGAVVGGLLWGQFPPSDARRRAIVEKVRPTIFLAPSIVFLFGALVVPVIRTVWLSFRSRRSDKWVGLDNYKNIFTADDTFTVSGFSHIVGSKLFIIAAVLFVVTVAYIVVRNATTKRGIDLSAPLPVVSFSASFLFVLLAIMGVWSVVIWNNILWVVLVTGVSTVLGLAIAVLADRAKGESVAKSLIFLPMAVSFVGASVIWRFVYAFTPEGSDQIGLLNAIWVGFGGHPQTWIQMPHWNNLFLMAIMIWIQTGFAVVVLSAAIKAVPDELLEAARVDGASEGQIFWRITVPQIRPTITVVITTLMITVLKVYDIVKVMTNGQFGTEVLANRMFNVSFINRDSGLGSALAVLILVAVLPVMIMNIRRMRSEGRS